MNGRLRLIPINLDNEAGGQLAAAVRDAGGGALLAAAGFAARLFLITVPELPGLSFIGGQARAPWPSAASPGGWLNFGGTGLSPAAAFAGCVGEGIEHLSQFERPGDVLAGTSPDLPAPVAAMLADLGADPGADRVAGIAALDDAAASLPAALCLRRPPGRSQWQPPWHLSCGCAAGPDRAAAMQRAILELVERDAVGLWWIGGRPGRAADPIAARAAADVVERLRGSNRHRVDWILDITTDIGIPTIVALSTDHEGRQLACGFAARPDMADAARAATLEMAQVELAIAVARTKLDQAGSEGLTPADRQHLARAAHDTASWSILRPAAAPSGPLHGGSDPAACLHALDFGLWLVDLTRPDFGLPVMRAVAPDLQPFPSSRVTARLAAIRMRHGGGPGSAGIDLL